MIISHHHKFVFVAIPKTATHAIRNALRPLLKTYDWEQCALFEEKKFPIEELAAQSNGHLACTQVEPYFPKGTWDSYFKFCFVRNPYDRFVSFCNYYYTAKMSKNPEATMLSLFEEPKTMLKQHILLKPQHEFVFDENLVQKVDFIGKFEHIATDFKTVCNHLKLTSHSLTILNESYGNKQVVNDKLASYIYDHYKLDFELFKYSKLYTSWQKNQ
ncbi:MAG: sulfotransferase family 2 domain-containing protein [Flammeovirgaceae bacterium]